MSAVRSCLLIFGLLNTVVSLGATAESNTSPCIDIAVDPEHLVVYIGWPHMILCNQLGDELDHNFYNDDGVSYNSEILCKIWGENDTLLFNETTTVDDLMGNNLQIGYPLPDLQDGDPVNFTLQTYVQSSGKCLSRNIHLILKPFEQITCEDFAMKDQMISNSAAAIGGTKIFTCDVEASTYPKIYAEDVTYQWTRNCSGIPQDLANDTRELRIDDIGFDDAGLYTCSVTYNGMTRYTYTDSVCVQHPPSSNKQTLRCKDSDLRINRGKDATFECEGNFGKGTFTDFHIMLSWTKQFPNGSFAPWRRCDSSDWLPLDSERVQCIYTLENKPCMLHIASEEEREAPDAIIPVQLKIRNIEQADYGTYVITSATAFSTSTDVNVTMTLSKDPIPRQRKIFIAVTTFLGAVLIILAIIAIITYKYSLYVKVYYKRFHGPYVSENRQYGAYMAYHFSDDIDKFVKENLRESVNFVRQRLEDMSYTIYDEAKDGYHSQYRAENIKSMIHISHRIILFLTLDYLKDDWSLLALHKALDEMINSESKLIFILHPGIKEYLKQHQNDVKDNEKTETAKTCCLIKRAIYLNYAIELSNDERFDVKSFNLQLELAMPKLKPKNEKDFQRFLSTSSNGFDSLYDYKNVKFERGFSNETQFTEIYVPDDHISSWPIQEQKEALSTYL